jgi:hypothetical protein
MMNIGTLVLRNRSSQCAVAIILGGLLGHAPAHAQCTLTCPDDITVNTSDPEGVTVTYPQPTTMGACGTIEQTQGLSSGEVFPLGVVMVSFRDEPTNSSASCSFLVTVLSPRGAPIFDSSVLGVLIAAFAGLGFWSLHRSAKAGQEGP